MMELGGSPIVDICGSEPKGPVYLQGTREVMEEVIEPYTIQQKFWKPIELGGLTAEQLAFITDCLIKGREPLVVTGYGGRDAKVVASLVQLANTIPGLRVLDTGGSDMSFPADHPAWLGFRYGSHDSIRSADMILVLDCDVPWINTQCVPREDATIIHLDTDPLKQQMPLFYIDAVLRCRVSVTAALTQILQSLAVDKACQQKILQKRDAYQQRKSALQASHTTLLRSIVSQAVPHPDTTFGAPYLLAQVRKSCPPDTIWAVEAVTNTPHVADQIQATLPGSWLNCGGGGLGWSGGGALGIKMATDSLNGGPGKGAFVCQIVGDGCFLFSMPSSVFWIGQKYKIPVLTILLNNDGETGCSCA